MGPGDDRAGLYVHVPFCDRACPYCDFDFEVGRGPGFEGRVDAWLAGLERELGRRAAELAGSVFDTLYIGGGTPSAIPIGRMRALLGWLGDALGVEPGELRELTVELNPEHASPARLDALVELGVDRVSVGVQSLSPAGLRQLGRGHERADALASVAACVTHGLRTSADLIVGWPGQTSAQLGRELAELTDAGVEHLSIYGLTIEPDTPWPKLVRRGLRVLPDDDAQAELLCWAERELVDRGFVHYEVASYARPGAEAVHNGKYWRWLDVIGLGPSAASVRHRRSEGSGSGSGSGVVERWVNPRGLAAWLEPDAPSEHERLEGTQAAAEGLWLGLRRLQGIEVGRFLDRFGVDLAWLDARVARQVELGNLRWSAERAQLGVAPGRWLWHDTIAVDLLAPR
ncbi:coproporphyrinogen-III oxidase family protein [Enhygromyxa salina]|uniref:coproporphyrinogen-III oxidase family protein n=1 Tax=Enhygromyxa salina TaxID=215803 RepID=UPI0015E61895|nr:coproporphyrinogen-III oxidase family protein [Enhygromyxa salina]